MKIASYASTKGKSGVKCTLELDLRKKKAILNFFNEIINRPYFSGQRKNYFFLHNKI